jgi:hypothetical protein
MLALELEAVPLSFITCHEVLPGKSPQRVRFIVSAFGGGIQKPCHRHGIGVSGVVIIHDVSLSSGYWITSPLKEQVSPVS